MARDAKVFCLAESKIRALRAKYATRGELGAFNNLVGLSRVKYNHPDDPTPVRDLPGVVPPGPVEHNARVNPACAWPFPLRMP